MSLIKDLTKVKDDEITLQDVKRAEEIIARANKLLGRRTVEEHHYWHGWNGILNVQPLSPFSNTQFCGTSATATGLCTSGTDLANVNLTEAVKNLINR